MCIYIYLHMPIYVPWCPMYVSYIPHIFALPFWPWHISDRFPIFAQEIFAWKRLVVDELHEPLRAYAWEVIEIYCKGHHGLLQWWI